MKYLILSWIGLIGFGAMTITGYWIKTDTLNIFATVILSVSSFIAFQLLYRSDLILQEYKRKCHDT